MTSAERKRNERDRKRGSGLVLKQIWVDPDKWVRIQSAIKRIMDDNDNKKNSKD